MIANSNNTLAFIFIIDLNEFASGEALLILSPLLLDLLIVFGNSSVFLLQVLTHEPLHVGVLGLASARLVSVKCAVEPESFRHHMAH
jgi:hypothetical protein